MSEGLRRFPAIALLMLFAACATKPAIDRADRAGKAPPNDCSRGVGTAHKEKPVVCVSHTPAGIVVQPETIELWDVLPSDRTKPVMIHWVTRGGGGDLQIRMKDDGCVADLQCNEKGHCHAKAIDITGSKRCSYGIFLDGTELDPDIVLTDCC